MEEPRREGRARTHVSTVILVSFLTAVATATGTVFLIERYHILEAPPAPAAESVVPDFKGLSESDARASAAAAQLTLVVSGSEATADAKPESVLRQSIPAGQKVPPQHTVGVVLAAIPPTVPAVEGMTVEEATQRLKDQGYTIQVAGSVPHATVPKGQVALQMPKAEASYVKGGAVTVQLSDGPGEVELPSFVGQSYNKAKTEVESLGLKLVVGWTSLGETPTYVVLNQAPQGGTKLEPGSEVRFTVNR